MTAFDQDLVEPANGLNYNYGKISQYPKNDIGYFALDLQATKTFEFRGDSSLQVRVDLLNATNRRNYAVLFDGYPGIPFYFTDGDISGVPRTIKLSMNVRF